MFVLTFDYRLFSLLVADSCIVQCGCSDLKCLHVRMSAMVYSTHFKTEFSNAYPI